MDNYNNFTEALDENEDYFRKFYLLKDNLKQNLERFNNFSNKSLQYIDTLDKKFASFDQYLMPIHSKTHSIHKEMLSVEQNIQVIETVISYFQISTILSNLINGGIYGKLDIFFETMEKASMAINFFKDISIDNSEINILTVLVNSGNELVEKHFKSLLQMSTKPLNPQILIKNLNWIFDEKIEFNLNEIDINDLTEQDEKSLIRMVSYLSKEGRNADYISVYSQIRVSNIQQTLQTLESCEYFHQLYSQEFKTHIPHYQKQQLAKSHVKPSFKSSVVKRISPNSEIDKKTSDEEFEKFVIMVISGAVLLILINEKQLMLKLIPIERQNYVMGQFLSTVIDTVFNKVELYLNRNSFESIVDLSSIQIIAHHFLHILKFMHKIKPHFDVLIKFSYVDSKKRLIKIYSLLESTIHTLFKHIMFCAEYEKDIHHPVAPKDASVHENCVNLMIIIEDIILNFEIVTVILLFDTTNKSTNLTSTNFIVVASFIHGILASIGLNLQLKARAFESSLHQMIFLMNNYFYIIKTSQRIGLVPFMIKNNHETTFTDLNKVFDNQFDDYLKQWKKCSQHLLDSSVSEIKLVEYHTLGKALSDKQKHAIKNVFKTFNSFFEEIYNQHKGIAVNNSELVKQIHSSLFKVIGDNYRHLYEKFKDIPFSTNPIKYIKYSPENINKKILSLFID